MAPIAAVAKAVNSVAPIAKASAVLWKWCVNSSTHTHTHTHTHTNTHTNTHTHKHTHTHINMCVF
jgi:hypothetical protein